METICLIFILVKVADGIRIFERMNVIVNTLIYSLNLILVFLGLLIVFNLAMVPLAQAIWGTYLIGYKTFPDTVVSVFLIAYSKGNLEDLLELNIFWSLVFMVMYYMIAIFFIHAAFHHVQTDALKNVVLLHTLKETDVISDVVKEEITDPKHFQAQQQRKLVEEIVRSLKWLFGWAGRSQLKMLDKIKDMFGPKEEDSDDEE